MFWRFGFHYTSSIDSILDRDDLTLDSLLDEDDLLQECKAKNPRLVDYLRQPRTLEGLLNVVSNEEEDVRRAQLASEILCCDIPAIVEGCVANAEQLLTPFWQRTLSLRSLEPKILSGLDGFFVKINIFFIGKMPAEMLDFVRQQPDIIEKLLSRIESPQFSELLLCLMKLHERPGTDDVLEWMASQRMVPRLVDLLSSSQSERRQHSASEVLKGVIAMSSPSQGQSGLSEGLQNHNPASNVLARELGSQRCILQLCNNIFENSPRLQSSPLSSASTSNIPSPLSTKIIDQDPACSSIVNSASVIIDLVRKNNSDYLETLLFHTLRNRLIQVQQHSAFDLDKSREVLESAMTEMTHKVGVVNFDFLLQTISCKLPAFRQLLDHSYNGPWEKGSQLPWSYIRLQLCELISELFHCSNMSLFNRSRGLGPEYSERGQLEGGLSALEKLAQVVSTVGQSSMEGSQSLAEDTDMRPSKELPVSAPSSLPSMSMSSPSFNSEDSFSGGEGSDEDLHYDTEQELLASQDVVSLEVSSNPTPEDSILSTSEIFTEAHSRPRSRSREKSASAGQLFRNSLMQAEILPTVLHLFFQYPWNNLLHTVVYDLISQILTARLDRLGNRELIISLFKDARLVYRILDALSKNDAKPANRRYGYTGHLTLLTEQILLSLNHFPEDIVSELVEHVPQPAWDEYVHGAFCVAKAKDAAVLGGGKPATSSVRMSGSRWAKVDEQDDVLSKRDSEPEIDPGESSPAAARMSPLKGEFRRVPAFRQGSRSYNADFGTPSPQDLALTTPNPGSNHQFTHYFAPELSPKKHLVSPQEDTSDEDDDAGWLSQSQLNLAEPAFTSNSSKHHHVNLEDNPATLSPKNSLSNTQKPKVRDRYEIDDDPFPDNAKFEDTDDPFGDLGDFQEGGMDGTIMEGSWTWDAESETKSDIR